MTKSPSTTARLATFTGVGAIALWCWSGPCYAVGARALGAMPYLTFSTAVGAVVGALYHVKQGHALIELIRLPRRVFLAGFFGVAIYTILISLAAGMAEDADLGQVLLLNYAWPIWMVLLSLVLLEEKPCIKWVLIGAALGFGGVVVVKGAETFTRTPSSLLPHAMALIASILWALYSVLIKRWNVPEKNNASSLQFAVCSVMAALIGLVNGEWRAMPPIDLSALAWIVFFGVGPIGLGYYWWEVGVKRGSAHLLAVLAYFIPVGAAVLIGLLFKEAVSPGLLPGAMMIAAGAFLSRMGVDTRRDSRSCK
jgi:drug/metabolite transporter (DMT)-like permease